MPPWHVGVHGCFPAPWAEVCHRHVKGEPRRRCPGLSRAVCSTRGRSNTKAKPGAAGDRVGVPKVLRDPLAQHGSRSLGTSGSHSLGTSRSLRSRAPISAGCEPGFGPAAKMLDLGSRSTPSPARGWSGDVAIRAKSRFLITTHPPCKHTGPRRPHHGCFGAIYTPGRAQSSWDGGRRRSFWELAGRPGPGGSSRAANPRPSRGCAGTFCPCQRRDGRELRVSPSPRHGRAGPPPLTLRRRTTASSEGYGRRAGTEHPPGMGGEGGRSSPAACCRKVLRGPKLQRRGPGTLQGCELQRGGVPVPPYLRQRGPTFLGLKGKKEKREEQSRGEWWGDAFPCPSQGADFAGWSGKHFPMRGAKSYKYSQHCNCVMHLLPSIGSPCRGPAGITAHGTGPSRAQQTTRDPPACPKPPPMCR